MSASILTRINRWRQLHSANDSLFEREVETQKAFLDWLPQPKDDIERSYLQYRCQEEYPAAGWKLFVKNACARGLVWSLLLRTVPAKKKNRPEGQPEAAFVRTGVTQAIIPRSVQQSFRISEFSYIGSRRLTEEERTFFKENVWKRYRRQGYFCLKLLLRMEMYSYVLSQGTFQAIITHGEYSYTSSFLTAYCHFLGVEHINVMHGDKLFDITDSFFHFDRCYVWDDHFVRLFTQLRAEPTQFRVELPPAMQPWSERSVEKAVDYTYYLQTETSQMLEKIADNLRLLQARGAVVAVRPHPRYSDKKTVQQMFSDFLIELNDEIDIESSILRTRHVIGRYSTVLCQAHINGVPIVIDDLTEPTLLSQLTERQFWGLSMPHTLLSEHTTEK